MLFLGRCSCFFLENMSPCCFFLAASSYSDDGVVNVGDYKLFPGEKWTVPSTMLNNPNGFWSGVGFGADGEMESTDFVAVKYLPTSFQPQPEYEVRFSSLG